MTPGQLALGVIPVLRAHGSPGLTQPFSFISSSRGALGIREGFWEHRQGRGNYGKAGEACGEKRREDSEYTVGAEVAFPIGEPRVAIHGQAGGVCLSP